MKYSLLHKSIAAIFCIILVGPQYSCIESSKSTDYTFLIDESLLQDSLSLVEAITKFGCSTCPNNIDGYQEMLVPGKNSNIIIYNESTKTARNFKIYNYNFFENFANSSVGPNRYFTHLSANIEKGFLNYPSSPFKLDSLISTLDSNYLTFSNFIFQPAIPKSNFFYIKDMPSSLRQKTTEISKQKNSTIKHVLVYLKASTYLPPNPETFNPKKEVYNALRTFYEHLKLLYINDYTAEQKEGAKALILQSFNPNAIFEIQNKKESKPTTYKINDFLNRITSDNRFQYDDVSFFMQNFSFLQDPVQSDSDIPGEYKGTAKYDQVFEAKNKGQIIYSDKVNKNVLFSIQQDENFNEESKMILPKYKYIIDTVTVNYVN